MFRTIVKRLFLLILVLSISCVFRLIFEAQGIQLVSWFSDGIGKGKEIYEMEKTIRYVLSSVIFIGIVYLPVGLLGGFSKKLHEE